MGFNGAVTSQTVPAKILATQLLERLETKKTTEIGQDFCISEMERSHQRSHDLKAANTSLQTCTQNGLFVFYRRALSRPAAPQLFKKAHKL